MVGGQREKSNRPVVDRRERDGGELAQITVGDGCQVLIPQRDALDTCPSRVPAD